MQEPLQTSMGYLRIVPGAQDILNGTFQCPANTTPPYAAWLIQGLKRIDGTHEEPIHVGMPTEEYCQGWKQAKEKTSAEPLTLHFGHCKAGALDPRIIEFEAVMASIPMKSRYAPPTNDGAKEHTLNYSRRQIASTFPNSGPLCCLRRILTLPTRQWARR
jgi:hypothetical protein